MNEWHKFFLLNFLFASVCLFSDHSNTIQSKLTNKYYDLVICAIFKNEANSLEEWMNYHKQLGVEHFYLYNNESTDHFLEILDPFLRNGEVELFDIPVKINSETEFIRKLQIPAYNHALKIVQKTAKWAAFIDIDEFICPKNCFSIPELLIDYQEFGGLAMNWQVFGTSYINQLPENGLMIEHLTWKAPVDFKMNQLTKVIVQPQKVYFFWNPHFAHFKQGFFAVNCRKEPIIEENPRQKVSIETVQLNHYWFGTHDFFINHKMPRRRVYGITPPEKGWEELIETCNQELDFSIQKFVPLLKNKMIELKQMPQ